ncbi:phage tail assembly protein [Pandoraea cepalis]|uniref:Phage tail assembly protein n=1 Tax=Pandoraea cepalis TaxID=2508294 RepID=A0AAW7MJR5_9BURK|nr:phage tail assembly protein [Pandoraea cepalis]MDN4572900.1 phage tail assembly protein [Pandoraea cepalis]MDN4577263.1 phage tail assembly protein [Pandoraea cepalis]
MKEVITLDTPIQRGETAIAEVEVKRPGAGQLRGVSLYELGQMQVDALIKVLPRITTPTLTELDVARLDPADLMLFGLTVVGFLTPKSAKADASLEASTTPSPTSP